MFYAFVERFNMTEILKKFWFLDELDKAGPSIPTTMPLWFWWPRL